MSGKFAIEPGDVVEMTTSRLPNSGPFRAAVERAEGMEFSVFSTDLAEYGLEPEDLTFRMDRNDFEILGFQKGEDAIPREAGGFAKGERLRTKVADPEGQFLEGAVVAAISGLVYCVADDGRDFTAETRFLEKRGSE